MDEISVKNVTERNVDDLCWVCVSPETRHDPDWIRGVADKKKWAVEMRGKWGPFAKVAYLNGTPAGMIQYRPFVEERVVRIDCICVLTSNPWRKGVGTRLLGDLLEDAKKPHRWFDSRRPSALVTRTFPSEAPGQYSAREFFKKKGLKQIGKDPDDLYYPLQPGFVYEPVPKREVRNMPQDKDKSKVVLVSGPDFCPATYPYFLKRMERYIREIYPDVRIMWIDSSEEPEEVRKRNVSVGACIVEWQIHQVLRPRQRQLPEGSEGSAQVEGARQRGLKDAGTA